MIKRPQKYSRTDPWPEVSWAEEFTTLPTWYAVSVTVLILIFIGSLVAIC